MNEVLEKLLEEDKDFAEARFKAKVDNIFIQLYSCVMRQDLSRVEHFLSKEVYNKYEKKINDLKNKNQIQMYDELNVSQSAITNIAEKDDSFEITIRVLTKYYNYLIDKTTKKFISGNRDYRDEKYITIVMSKLKNAKNMGIARQCDGCGANMDLNKTGVCEYCGTVFELKNYDWVVKSIED